MTTRHHTLMFAASLLAAFLANGWAQDKLSDNGTEDVSQISSLGESLRSAGQRPLHILYVHGIGVTGSGDSHALQQGICKLLKACELAASPVARDYADTGAFENGAEPPAFEYMGKAVWRSREEWSASAPFVDHYVLRHSGGGPIVVDEINWWPLVFPLKCRAISAGEAWLAGPDSQFLNLCSEPTEVDPSQPGRFTTYSWITAQEARRLEFIRSKGALFNRRLKNGIMDWGFSDAIMAVGSMHGLFREAMRQLFVKSVRFNADGSRTDRWEQQLVHPQGIDREFIVVAHSLGSYLVFSTLRLGRQNSPSQNVSSRPLGNTATEDAGATYILERTSLVYLLANQIPLLDLANLGEPVIAGLLPAESQREPEAMGTLNESMTQWMNLRQNFGRNNGAGKSAVKPPHVVAWSDPSDLLSWHLPEMEGLVVTNLYVRNTRWHWLIARPVAAHDNYAVNEKVLRVMLGPKVSAKR